MNLKHMVKIRKKYIVFFFYNEEICFFLALSALEPVVYDLFLIRLKTDNKELEAQRMVIVQTLLKLVRYNKVIRHFSIADQGKRAF
jgi:hypothetical protein